MSEQTERLSPSDMSSLLAERGPIHVHVGATMCWTASRPTLDELLGARRGAPPARAALPPAGHPHPAAGSTNPVWGDDPGFDLRWHVRHVGAAGARQPWPSSASWSGG